MEPEREEEGVEAEVGLAEEVMEPEREEEGAEAEFELAEEDMERDLPSPPAPPLFSHSSPERSSARRSRSRSPLQLVSYVLRRNHHHRANCKVVKKLLFFKL